jgi:F-type H+-transporting ATPase subunit b
MSFDSTTFVLEVANFLVLVWILQRFLYRPVAAIIAQREAQIATRLNESEIVRAEAQALKRELEDRSAVFEREREAARSQIEREVEEERAQRLAKLSAQIEAERETANTVERQRLDELRRRARAEGYAAAGVFAERLLSRLASRSLEAALAAALLEDVDRLAREGVVQPPATATGSVAQVVSAYPLEEPLRGAIAAALSRIAGRPIVCEFSGDAALVAGLRIALGPWVVSANLQDELRWFAEAAQDAS